MYIGLHFFPKALFNQLVGNKPRATKVVLGTMRLAIHCECYEIFYSRLTGIYPLLTDLFRGFGRQATETKVIAQKLACKENPQAE